MSRLLPHNASKDISKKLLVLKIVITYYAFIQHALNLVNINNLLINLPFESRLFNKIYCCKLYKLCEM